MPQEYVARWVGGRIGAGASVFHFQSIGGGTSAQALANAVRALFNTLAAALPNDITIQFDTEVKEISDAGVLTAVYPVTPPANVNGTGSTVWINGTGILVRHSTAAIIAGRRLLGRTFLVPVTAASFNDAGDVLSSTITAFNAAFATLNSTAAGLGANFAVWSRKNATTSPVVVSATVPRPSTLKTRNDRV